MNDPTPQINKQWSVVRGFLWTTLIVFLLFIAGVGVISYLFYGTPDYWKPLNAADPQVRASAVQVEARVSSEMTLIRPAADTWQVTVDEADANSWLATRLPQWLANQGVSGAAVGVLRASMFHFADGKIEIATQVNLAGMEQILRFAYDRDPASDADGPLRLRLASVMAGRLPLPVETVIGQLSQHFPAGTQKQLEDFNRGVALLRSLLLTLPLGDGRNVRVVDFKIVGKTLTLTCKTDFTPRRR